MSNFLALSSACITIFSVKSYSSISPVILQRSHQYWVCCKHTLPFLRVLWQSSNGTMRCLYLGASHYSNPKVLVSSTAVNIFSYNMEKDGYGGRSSRLKQVWALKKEKYSCHYVTMSCNHIIHINNLFLKKVMVRQEVII